MSIINNEKSLETTQFQGFYYGRGRRIRSRLPARSVLLLRRGLHRRPVLTCRFGQCFCFAEVSTGHPHPTTRSACRESNPFVQTKKKKSRKTTLFLFGRGRRIRTLGTRFWRPLLYQLSYTPVSTFQRPMR